MAKNGKLAETKENLKSDPIPIIDQKTKALEEMQKMNKSKGAQSILGDSNIITVGGKKLD